MAKNVKASPLVWLSFAEQTLSGQFKSILHLHKAKKSKGTGQGWPFLLILTAKLLEKGKNK